jgi:hypothetical protein
MSALFTDMLVVVAVAVTLAVGGDTEELMREDVWEVAADAGSSSSYWVARCSARSWKNHVLDSDRCYDFPCDLRSFSVLRKRGIY